MVPRDASDDAEPGRAAVSSRWAARVAVACRLFLGLIFFTGGMSKLLPFPGLMGPVWLEEALEPHGLALYARFIAWSEALIGLLLLSPRYATVGTIMLVPMLANILMVTVSMEWRGTPAVITFFLALNLYLVVYDYQRWKFLFATDKAPLMAVRAGRLAPVVEARHALGIALVLAGVPLHALSPPAAYGAIAIGLVATAWPRRAHRQANC